MLSLLVVTRSALVGVIYAQSAAHDFVIIQIAHGGSSGICIGELHESEAFRFAGVFVVDETEVEHCADLTKDVNDLLFGKTFFFGEEVSKYMGFHQTNAYHMECCLRKQRDQPWKS